MYIGIRPTIQLFLITVAAAVLAVTTAADSAERTMRQTGEPAPAHTTFSVETYVARTYNYLDTMVDQNGLPYFNIFWTEPAEAAHDWPDFGDVMSRQLQAAIMARHV